MARRTYTREKYETFAYISHASPATITKGITTKYDVNINGVYELFVEDLFKVRKCAVPLKSYKKMQINHLGTQIEFEML